MHYLFYGLLAISWLSGQAGGWQQDQPTSTPAPASISSPLPGQALQGSVPITLILGTQEFQGIEISFAYQDDPTDTWFLILQSDEEVSGADLPQWDTTTLTDGEYTLRVDLSGADGSQTSLVVPDLRVRNYTAIETDTPVPTETAAPGDTPVPTSTATATITPIPPTGTPLPPNPAQLTTQDITFSLGKGALGAAAALALIGLYSAIKNAFRR
ncbi:MAG TPA: hypothetical protein VFZ76_16835 [Anaerolineales bacterium]